MNKIYKYRPPTDTTLDELKDSYLWFSRPIAFKDTDDANIIAFSNANENIKESIDRVLGNYENLAEKLSYIGISCFTDFLPECKEWRHFPKGNKKGGIFIEYDKDKLEQYFFEEYGIGDCFKKVEYIEDQLLFKSSTYDNYDILWETDGKNCVYRSIRGDLELDEKLRDELILKMLTRLNFKFRRQRESRILLYKQLLEKRMPDIKGYAISIPFDVILKIYVHPKTPKKFIKKFRTILPLNLIKIID